MICRGRRPRRPVFYAKPRRVCGAHTANRIKSVFPSRLRRGVENSSHEAGSSFRESRTFVQEEPAQCNSPSYKEQSVLWKKAKDRSQITAVFRVGIDLSSRSVSRQVLSALMSLTSVFGMGTGGPSSLKTPTKYPCGTPQGWYTIRDSNPGHPD